MDRFIERFNALTLQHTKAFKIQYGQIYSIADVADDESVLLLKSNMDRFIDMLYDKVSNMFVF